MLPLHLVRYFLMWFFLLSSQIPRKIKIPHLAWAKISSSEDLGGLITGGVKNTGRLVLKKIADVALED